MGKVKELCNDINHLHEEMHNKYQEIEDILKNKSTTSVFESSDYEINCKQFAENYSLGHLGNELNTKLLLISLICAFTLKFRESNSEITTLQVIKQVTNYNMLDPNNTLDAYRIKFYETLAIMSTEFLYGVTKVDTFGLKNGNEIKNKINEILETWTLF